MADQKLTVVVGADVSQLKRGIEQAEKSLHEVEKSATTTGKSFSDMGKMSQFVPVAMQKVTSTATDAAAAITKIPSAAKNVSSSIAAVGKSSANTGVTLTNLGRIASDAPFGFIAIQNNLDPLIQSFGQLKQQTGGTGAALKSLFASLAGPAGIALGFSLVASAATTLIQKYGSLGKAFEALTNATNKEFQARQQILDIQKEATKSAGEEVARLKVLTSLAADTTQSYEFRARAVQTLQKEFGPYLKNVTEEALLNGNAAKATNEAANAILNKALALAAEKKLGVIGGALLDNQLAQIDAAKRLERANSNLSEQARKSAGKEIQGREGVNLSLESYRTETTKVSNEVKRLAEEGIKAQAEFDKVLNLSTEFAKRAGTAFFGNAPKDKKVEKTDFTKFVARDFVTQLDQDLDEEFRKLNPIQDRIQEFIFDPIDLITANINTEKLRERQARIEAFQEQQRISILSKNKLLFEQLKAQNEQFTNILSQGLAQPLGDLIFNFLDKGKFAFKDFANAAIEAIKRIAAQLIATKIIQLLSSLTPFGQAAKVGAGFGKFLGAGGLFNFLGGSQIGNPSFGGVGGGLGSVQFRLAGSDLVGSIQRTQGRINRVG